MIATHDAARVTRSPEHLVPNVRLAVDAARARNRPVVVAIGLEPPSSLDPLALFAAATPWTDERFFWEQPSRGIATAAVGSVAAIEARGSGRFASASACVARLFADLIRVGDPAPVRLVGGFAFDATDEPSDRWRDFPHGSLTLPELLYHREPAGPSLTVCRRVAPHDDPHAIAAAIQRSVALAFDHAADGGRLSAPMIVGREEHPGAESWKESVARAASAVTANRFRKVVLARSLEIAADAPFAEPPIADRLRTANPSATTFVAAKGRSRFLGATPELLVRLRGRAVETVALAGSIARGADEAADRDLARQLLASAKDRVEHEVVVQTILEALAPLCPDVDRAAGTPRVERSRAVQHLATPIAGTLAPGWSALDLVGRLHPTPAVGGAPRDDALSFIREHERLDRGWYAGPLGWIDAGGDAEFVVALRSGLVERNRATLFAGCGIVAASQPDAEYRETGLKFGPMLDALGLA